MLRKRLKNYYKKRKLMKAKIRQIKKTNFDYFAVIDFEATCEENNIDFHHEIIEFPIVLVDIKKMEIVRLKEMDTLGFLTREIIFVTSCCFLDHQFSSERGLT